MKIMRYVIGGCMLVLSACQGEDVGQVSEDDGRIYLRAALSEQVASRTPYELTAPTTLQPLDVDVWASTEEDASGQVLFKHEDGMDGSGTDSKVSLHTTASFQSSNPQLLSNAIYPKQEKVNGSYVPVYFVSMYPQNGWSTTDGLSANASFTGKEDLLFAPRISGTYNTAYESSPQLHFYHLLTWLRIQVVAENEDASTAWGKVTKMSIQSKKAISVTLNGAVAEKADLNSIAKFTGEASEIPLYQTGTDTPFENQSYELKGPYGKDGKVDDFIEEVAYVLCEPVQATAHDAEDANIKTSEYILSITTENRGTIELDVDLMKTETEHFTGSTMGMQFTLLLKFKTGDKISVNGKVAPWVTGGMGSGDFEDKDLKTTN